MRLHGVNAFLWTTILALCTGIWTSCSNTENRGSAAASSDNGKIPITTSSDEARKEFLQGRDLSEKLLAQDSLAHFDKAIALDPNFASAELARANSSPTPNEFFDHQKKAVSLADKVSEPERLLILANQAGANGDVTAQKADLEKLVAACPNDERAHFALAQFYFGQQDYAPAIEHYKKATEIAPNYSIAYNLLGYAYRQQGNYADAEQAFKRYIELIPNDPNPYDSYAELLLKMGRFDESIVQYRRALTVDPHFVPSHFGISADLTYLGKHAEAESELQTMASVARIDGELRTALFGMAVVAADSGQLAKAAQQIDKEYAVAEKKNDNANMSADLQARGIINLEAQKLDAAQKDFERSLQLIDDSSLSQEIKDNAKLQNHFNLAAVAIAKKDFSSAQTHVDEYKQGAEVSKNAPQIRLSHEIAGRLAAAQKDWDKAIEEFEQSNLQDPRNLYRLAECYRGKGDAAKAKEYAAKAANFNSLPALPYAFIRVKAKQWAGNKA